MNYLIARLKNKLGNLITVEANSIGYEIYVSTTFKWDVETDVKILIYEEQKLDKNNNISKKLFGFLKKEEYDFFLLLLEISGIGAKIALNILGNEINELLWLLKTNNVLAIANLKGFNVRIANLLFEKSQKSKKIQALLAATTIDENYKNKLSKKEFLLDDGLVFDTLKTIGYPDAEIQKAINFFIKKEIKFNNISDAVNECIKNISFPHEIKDFPKKEI